MQNKKDCIEEMSIEVEIKLKIKDKKELEKKLPELGFDVGDIVSESDAYYTSEFHDFAKLDEALRIRSIEHLTTKEKAALRELEKILKMLGYSMKDTTRRSYLSMMTGEEN